MDMQLLQLLGYLAILIGLLGSVAPVLPGPLLIWLGVLLWAWGDGFTQIGWPLLSGLALLVLIARGLDLVLTTSMSRRAGVSWRAIGGALLGAILGAIFLSGLPIIGTLLGALLGAAVGMWSVEYLIKRDKAAASAALRAYLSGAALSALAQVAISLLMTLLFIWQAFFDR
jgi:hypothetical protein